MYKICVVGAGYWGKNHIKTLNDLGALGGVVELDKGKIEKLVDKYPSINIHSDLEEALLNDYDGFTIATPAESHFGIAKRIISNGNNVLIEKPMTLSIKDADELVELSKAKNINVMVGHVLLFHPAIKKIKEIIDSGTIGRLQYIYSNRLNLGTVRTQENVFWSLAPHDIAIFQFLTNSFPKSIQATGSTFLQEGIPDSTLTHLQYVNGVKGHIFVSWLHPFKEHRLVVIGSEAMITFEDSLDGKPLKLYTKKFELGSGVVEKIDGPVDYIDYEKKMPLTAEFEYFLGHLNDNRKKISDVHHGLEVVKTLVEAGGQLKNE